LEGAVFGAVPLRSVNYIDGAAEPAAECARYAKLLRENPPDIVFMGIGENGHLAFNDPPVAYFNDPETVKTVDLDESCRMQQVHDGCFPAIGDVPAKAITLTIPALLSAGELFCIVPGHRKARAVADALTGEISEACPASILRKKRCRMYIDRECAKFLA
jgi:glucosamine-6-phosphate deaminase